MGNKPGVVMDLGEMLIDTTVDAQVSSVFILDGPGVRWRQMFSSIIIECPESLTGEATLEVSHADEDTDAYGSTWKTHTVDNIALVLVEGGSAQLDGPLGRRIRVSTDSAEAANRRFRIRGVENAQ